MENTYSYMQYTQHPVLPCAPTYCTLCLLQHGNRIIRGVGKGLGWLARRVVRVKDAIGDRIPRPLRPKAVRRFLRLTDTLDVKK